MICPASLTNICSADGTRGTPAEAMGIGPDSSDEAILDAMVAEPILVERPIVVTDDGAISVVWKNYKAGPQDVSLFVPPADYQTVAMPAVPGL